MANKNLNAHKENDMEGDELRNAIMTFAKSQIEPFTTADVFKAVDEAEALDEVSNSLRKLFVSGHLARKKIDNLRYAYSIPANAPHDFSVNEEGILKKAEELSEKLFGNDGKTSSEKPIEASKNGKKTPKMPEKVDFSGGAREGFVHQLPEEFTLTLQTPGGLIITIASGLQNGAAS